MRLADEIIETAADRTLVFHADWNAWASRIKNAVRYEIDAAVGSLAHGVIRPEPLRTAVRVRPFTAFHEGSTWVEWLGPSACMGPRQDDPVATGKVRPTRSGVLIEATDGGRRGAMSWIYSMAGHGLEPTPFSVLFDWRDNPAEVPDLYRAAYQTFGLSWEDRVRKIFANSGFLHGIDCVTEERRYGVMMSHLMPTFWQTLSVAAARDPAGAERMARSSLDDLIGEPMFVVGWLSCMCTDGLLTVDEPEDLDRLNLARRKKGRVERLSFRQVHTSDRNVIRLSDRGGNIATMAGFHAA